MRILYLKTEGVVFVRPKDSTPSMRNEAQSVIRFDLFALNSLGLSSIQKDSDLFGFVIKSLIFIVSS